MATCIRVLPLEFGLFAKEAMATAWNESDKGELGLSILTNGNTQSNDPRAIPFCGMITKFVMKKQGACCSIGLLKPCCSIKPSEMERSDPFSTWTRSILTGEFASSSSSSERPVVEIIENFRSALVPLLDPVALLGFLFFSDRRALLSVALVSFRKTRSKSSL
jgi:hypothetical protein